MRNLSWLDKLLFLLNSLFALILLVSYLSYYISPLTISSISILSLTAPIFILLNTVFAIYWMVKLKRQFLLSTIVLIIGFQFINKFYSLEEKKILLSSDVKVMSYNVRLFNLYNWIEGENIAEKIVDFINSEDPDILCLQEFHPSKKINLKYPYKSIKISDKNNNFGHAIYSKFKIIDEGSLNFPNSNNNAIYIDILRNNDTVRFYNVHLESLRINPKKEELTQENSEKLRIRLEKAFKIQTAQVQLIAKNQSKIKHKSVICGDFNNNAFSWVYHSLLQGKNDTFEIAGKGFGNTYDFSFPVRIDFILADKRMEVNNFKTFDVRYSDHYPIMARLNF